MTEYDHSEIPGAANPDPMMGVAQSSAAKPSCKMRERDYKDVLERPKGMKMKALPVVTLFLGVNP
ncbi:MAG: hypothetical protein IH892_02370 [Planctomycetes bacterium]|nr:hypothetical protein [Planctomycetota bacterium]